MPRRKADFKTLASYSKDDEGFLCQICLQQHGDSLVWYDWEIPRHLKDAHRFSLNKKERMYRISGWNNRCEPSFRKNIHKKIRNPPWIQIVEQENEKEMEKEKQRKLLEYGAQRDR